MTDYATKVKELTELLEATKARKDEMDPAEYKKLTRQIRANRRKFAKMDPNAPVTEKKAGSTKKPRATKSKKVVVDEEALYKSVIQELENSGLKLKKFKVNDEVHAFAFSGIVNLVENGEALDVTTHIIKRFKIKWMVEPTYFVEFLQGKAPMIGLGPVEN